MSRTSPRHRRELLAEMREGAIRGIVTVLEIPAEVLGSGDTAAAPTRRWDDTRQAAS